MDFIWSSLSFIFLFRCISAQYVQGQGMEAGLQGIVEKLARNIPQGELRMIDPDQLTSFENQGRQCKRVGDMFYMRTVTGDCYICACFTTANDIIFPKCASCIGCLPGPPTVTAPTLPWLQSAFVPEAGSSRPYPILLHPTEQNMQGIIYPAPPDYKIPPYFLDVPASPSNLINMPELSRPFSVSVPVPIQGPPRPIPYPVWNGEGPPGQVPYFVDPSVFVPGPDRPVAVVGYDQGPPRTDFDTVTFVQACPADCKLTYYKLLGFTIVPNPLKKRPGRDLAAPLCRNQPLSVPFNLPNDICRLYVCVKILNFVYIETIDKPGCLSPRSSNANYDEQAYADNNNINKRSVTTHSRTNKDTDEENTNTNTNVKARDRSAGKYFEDTRSRSSGHHSRHRTKPFVSLSYSNLKGPRYSNGPEFFKFPKNAGLRIPETNSDVSTDVQNSIANFVHPGFPVFSLNPAYPANSDFFNLPGYTKRPVTDTGVFPQAQSNEAKNFPNTGSIVNGNEVQINTGNFVAPGFPKTAAGLKLPVNSVFFGYPGNLGLAQPRDGYDTSAQAQSNTGSDITSEFPGYPAGPGYFADSKSMGNLKNSDASYDVLAQPQSKIKDTASLFPNSGYPISPENVADPGFSGNLRISRQEVTADASSSVISGYTNSEGPTDSGDYSISGDNVSGSGLQREESIANGLADASGLGDKQSDNSQSAVLASTTFNYNSNNGEADKRKKRSLKVLPQIPFFYQAPKIMN